MVFSSLIFLCAFMPLFFIVYYLQKDKKYRNTVLFLFSLVFYAWGEPIYIFLVLLSIIANYYFAIEIEKNREIVRCEVRKYRYAEIKFAKKCIKWWFRFGIFFNITLIAIFKYADFFIGMLNGIFRLSLPLTNIPLPIGISFFTFQIMSYLIDVYYERVKVQKNFIYLGAYVAAFPQLVAGPIVRYQTIEDELVNRKESKKLAAEGIRRFIVGLAKKALIANNMAQVIKVLSNYSNIQFKMAGAIIIVLAYTIQIYFDFSGYSDMAIGLGKMMGFNYDENFNYPYIASSVTEFWRRWHISLSTFFRDYVYIPLGGNKVKPLRHILNILIVWFLTGMWHGASWNFVIWGLYYGLILIIEKYIPQKIKEKVPKFIGHILTLLIVMYGWIIFMFEDFEKYKEFIVTLFGKYGIGNVAFFRNIGLIQMIYIAALILGIVLSMPLCKVIEKKFENSTIYRVVTDAVLILIFAVSVVAIAAGSYNPFIYFKF